MSQKYKPWVDGEWHFITVGVASDDGFDIACCHCGLVHTMQVKMIAQGNKRRVKVRLKQQARATAAVRRPFKFAKEDD